MKLAWPILLLLCLPALRGQTTSAPAESGSCTACHSALEGALAIPAQLIKDDVHIKNGLSCTGCHGGDPSSMDMTVAMGRQKGFLGKIERRTIPEMCARCHSDAAFMHKFKPQQRVDQLALYKTSVHGKRLVAGDATVAVCTDCHSVHDIREVKDVLSPVYPLKMSETCSRCHSDQVRMAQYKIPTNQFAKYQKSVHWDALARQSDLSAPSCASCHGSHGAAPPGAESVARACGNCHVVFQKLFDESPHKSAFEALGLPGCAVCHDNHEIRKPTLDMLGVAGTAVCLKCHLQGDPGYAAALTMRQRMDQLYAGLKSGEDIVRSAERSGMEMSDARLQLAAADEEFVKAKTQVHRFRLEAVEAPVRAGLAATQQSYQLGVEALHERDVRRRGLLVSLAAILVTIVGLWLILRRAERGGTR